jgi:hypothetical protein
MILVDSSVWIDYFNGVICPETNLLDGFLGKESILMGDLILSEVLQGFSNDKDFQEAQQLLSLLPFREMLGHQVAIRSAENYRLLRMKGITVRKTIDVMIGTFCILNQLPLLHCDRDFDPMEKWLGLSTVCHENTPS